MLLLALASKEAAVSFIAILAAYQLRDGFVPQWKSRVASLAPHALVAGLYGAVKAVGVALTAIPPEHPYVTSFSTAEFFDGIRVYARWLGHAVAPFDGEPWIVLGLVGAAVIVMLRRDRRADFAVADLRFLAVMTVWFVAGMIPVIGLVNHRYAYYLTYSWIAVAATLVQGLARLTSRGRLAGEPADGWLLAAALLVTCSNVAAYASAEYREGVVAMVNPVVVASQLPNVLPTPPQGATLVFEGIDPSKFGGSAAPRIWYGDDTLTAVSANSIRCVDSRPVTSGPSASTPATAVFWFQERDGRLIRDPGGEAAALRHCRDY